LEAIIFLRYGPFSAAFTNNHFFQSHLPSTLSRVLWLMEKQGAGGDSLSEACFYPFVFISPAASFREDD
jgi:hypothetical protein